jgi:hypothetical protein
LALSTRDVATAFRISTYLTTLQVLYTICGKHPQQTSDIIAAARFAAVRLPAGIPNRDLSGTGTWKRIQTSHSCAEGTP